MEQYQESFKVQAMLMTESGKWQQAATMQRAARSASKPGEQRGWPLPSKLPRRGRTPGHITTWKGLQMGATQMIGRLMVLSYKIP